MHLLCQFKSEYGTVVLLTIGGSENIFKFVCWTKVVHHSIDVVCSFKNRLRIQLNHQKLSNCKPMLHCSKYIR